MTMSKLPIGKPWFNQKRVGIGIGIPCGWEGWAVIAAFLAVMFVGPQVIEDRMTFGIVAGLAVIALIGIVAVKTEGGWRRGTGGD